MFLRVERSFNDFKGVRFYIFCQEDKSFVAAAPSTVQTLNHTGGLNCTLIIPVAVTEMTCYRGYQGFEQN